MLPTYTYSLDANDFGVRVEIAGISDEMLVSIVSTMNDNGQDLLDALQRAYTAMIIQQEFDDLRLSLVEYHSTRSILKKRILDGTL